ncbi:MAG: PD40 domain-containing protein [Methylococcaceae bacterium]|nr:PD40 domain-containing protein [Methylococcaceae bacterium]
MQGNEDPILGGFFSYGNSLSADGRYVAFASRAFNLVAGGIHNINFDVFVHDRLTKQTTQVSVDSNGIQGNGDSFEPSISADGRYVAFSSKATNLVAPPLVGFHIYVHDRETKQTTLVRKPKSGSWGYQWNRRYFCP